MERSHLKFQKFASQYRVNRISIISLTLFAFSLYAPSQQPSEKLSPELSQEPPQALSKELPRELPPKLPRQIDKNFPELAAKPGPTLQPRQFSAVAHDSVDSQFLLFGGTYGSQRFADTWLLNSTGWTLQSPATSPAARITSAAAYDSLHKQFVLFGGRVQQAKPVTCSPGTAPADLETEYFCSDTWVFTGKNWVKQSPALSPPAREGHAMVFDAARNEVVLFGGTAGGGSAPLDDTWIWNGTTWKKAAPVHSPPARLWHSMAYDPVHKQVVLFGGDAGTHFLNDTWLWNGTDWQAAPTQATPPAVRTNAGLNYDPVSGNIVLFSGSVWTSKRNGSTAFDSWSWNGAQWKQIAASKFQLVTDFSKLTLGQAAAATLANGTPSILWLPVN